MKPISIFLAIATNIPQRLKTRVLWSRVTFILHSAKKQTISAFYMALYNLILTGKLCHSVDKYGYNES